MRTFNGKAADDCRGATASAVGGTHAQGNQRAHENHAGTLKELMYYYIYGYVATHC